ncbi:polysaccharide pyruvyl transferase family protein [Erysipelothrix aquatica]|uniref:polysaccharide pyruvyl transferase family protein n=1 Tax=Erysipelothrix aquatica TaxID=2683714 RepID=UPI00135A2DDD|nr:polysaccharide pyruvyl transferase family protein [Erysipelothrix aquatica]
MRKIALFGYYGQNNLGDDLIMETIINRINQKYPDSKITVYGSGQSLDVGENTYETVSKKSIKGMLSLLGNDIVFIGGGGLFPNKNIGKLKTFNILTKVLKFFGKKVYVIGIGIGSKNFEEDNSIELIKKIARRADYFAVRHDIPKELSDFIVSSADVVLSDPVFDYDVKHVQERYVTFSLANIMPHIEANNDTYNDFVNSIAKIVEFVLDQEMNIKLLTFTGKDDEILNRDLVKKVTEVRGKKISERIEIVPYNNNIQEVINLINNASLNLCMRFHAVVISIKTKTPLISLSYSDKSEDLMKKVELGKFSRKVGFSKNHYWNEVVDIDSKEINDLVEKLLKDDSEQLNKLEKHHETLETLSNRNFDWM